MPRFTSVLFFCHAKRFILRKNPSTLEGRQTVRTVCAVIHGNKKRLVLLQAVGRGNCVYLILYSIPLNAVSLQFRVSDSFQNDHPAIS